jgi:bla regulator protein BlaR1
MLFWIGAIVFAIRLLIQLFSLYKLYKNSKPATIQDHDVRLTNADISPFSFWQSIYINPENLNPDDLKSVLQHEQVHVKEWHTLDILLAEISVIFYWFNPGVWLIKKAVRENVEFITDRKILQKGTDSKTYQYSLLNVSITATTPSGITNHFNFSTLKKRIKMMNVKQSSNVNLTRYALLLPVVLICLFTFSVTKASFVRKSQHAYKIITVSVHNLVDIAKPKSVNIAEKPAKKITPSNTVKQMMMEVHKDTLIRKNFTFNAFRLPGEDTLTYFINGEKVTRAEFKKMQPADLEAIQIRDTYSGSANPKKIISILKRSPQGDLSLTDSGSAKHLEFVVIKRANDSTNTFHKGITDTIKRIRVKFLHRPLSSEDIKITHAELISNKGPANGGKFIFKTDDLNINEHANLLTVVDGKTINADDKAWKKIPAAEIKTVNVKDGPEMVKEYGDKAKNGVIFITSKKN